LYLPRENVRTLREAIQAANPPQAPASRASVDDPQLAIAAVGEPAVVRDDEQRLLAVARQVQKEVNDRVACF
jgi:uncharacterized membrane protein